MNILYAGFPLGGELHAKTRETRGSRYFSRASLPQRVVGAKEALSELRPLPSIVTWTREELWRLRLRFGWRWLLNRVTGHPEPKFPPFHVRAVAVLLSDGGRRILTLPGSGYNPADSALGFRTLPRVACDGEVAPWEQLTQFVERIISLTPDFQWVGLWQDADRGMFEFVFAAMIREEEFPGSAQWTTSRNAAFSDRDMAYVERVRPTFARDPVWTINSHDDPSDMITQDKEANL